MSKKSLGELNKHYISQITELKRALDKSKETCGFLRYRNKFLVESLRDISSGIIEPGIVESWTEATKLKYSAASALVDVLNQTQETLFREYDLDVLYNYEDARKHD